MYLPQSFHVGSVSEVMKFDIILQNIVCNVSGLFIVFQTIALPT